MIYTYNEILFSFRREGNSIIMTTQMNLEATMLNEITRHRKESAVLYDSTYREVPK